jgi:Fur family ferric uptake transcriptional regulator
VTSDTWRTRLRAGGHRVTPQREAVLRAVQELSHPCADSIHAYLVRDEPGLSLSTVYRNLTVLQDLGIITHAHVGPGAPVYHVASAEPHIHLSCLSCGAVASVPAATAQPFADAVAATTGFQVDTTHAAVYGVCASCRHQRPKEESSLLNTARKR